jgi:hypothetical protein
MGEPVKIIKFPQKIEEVQVNQEPAKVLSSVSKAKRVSGLASEKGGFVLAYRSIDIQSWSDDPVCMLVSQYLIRRAVFTELNYEYKGKVITLKSGQLATTLQSLAKKTAVISIYSKSKNPEAASKTAMDRCLKKLSEDGFLSYEIIGKGKTGFRIITIKNYCNFQSFRETKTETKRETIPETITETKERLETKGLQSTHETNAETFHKTIAETNPETQNKEGSLKKECNLINNDLEEDIESCDSESESEKVKPKSDKTSKKKRLPNCPHLKILELWSQVMPDKRQPSLSEWDSSRAAYKDLAARWKEGLTLKNPKTNEPFYNDIESGLHFWFSFFTWCSESQFLTQKCKPFSLDWALKKANFIKIKEGAYHE